ncbi:neural cell adhesion molecule 1-like [Littorina saxatilis]|uniref:neural cell adhesion molecule 1-like n=1 Tax=Littorina saxatilis TaxID=31220 RepID=UPI0038B4C2D5
MKLDMRNSEYGIPRLRPQEVEFEPFKDAELGCGLEDTSKNYTYIWTKGYLPVADIPVQGNQAYVDHGNGLLEIKHPLRSFAGLYVCVAQFEDNGKQRSIDIDVKYYATPQVLPFESKDVVLGETLTIECRVLGYPKPRVTWYKDGEPIVGGDEARYKLQTANTYNGEQMENARLQRDSVDLDDGGKYACVAKTDKWLTFNSTQEILVRVNEATVGTSTDSSNTRTSSEDEGDSDNNSTTTTDTESSSSNALAIGLGVAGGVCVFMAAVGAGVYFKERRPGQLYASPDNAPPASVPPDNGPQAAGSAVPPQN